MHFHVGYSVKGKEKREKVKVRYNGVKVGFLDESVEEEGTERVLRVRSHEFVLVVLVLVVFLREG